MEELIKQLTKLGGCSLVDEVNHVNMVVSPLNCMLLSLHNDVSINVD